MTNDRRHSLRSISYGMGLSVAVLCALAWGCAGKPAPAAAPAEPVQAEPVQAEPVQADPLQADADVEPAEEPGRVGCSMGNVTSGTVTRWVPCEAASKATECCGVSGSVYSGDWWPDSKGPPPPIGGEDRAIKTTPPDGTEGSQDVPPKSGTGRQTISIGCSAGVTATCSCSNCGCFGTDGIGAQCTDLDTGKIVCEAECPKRDDHR